jgi:hypothetical protein
MTWNDEIETRAKDLVASSLHRLSNADLIDAAPDLLESALAEIQRLRDARDARVRECSDLVGHAWGVHTAELLDVFLAAASPRPWTVALTQEEDETVLLEELRRFYDARQPGRLWCVAVPVDPDRPLSEGGDSGLIAMTGNGPTSEVHAYMIAAAPFLLEGARAELRRRAERIADLEAENAEWRRSAAGLEEEQ